VAAKPIQSAVSHRRRPRGNFGQDQLVGAGHARRLWPVVTPSRRPAIHQSYSPSVSAGRFQPHIGRIPATATPERRNSMRIGHTRLRQVARVRIAETFTPVEKTCMTDFATHWPRLRGKLAGSSVYPEIARGNLGRLFPATEHIGRPGVGRGILTKPSASFCLQNSTRRQWERTTERWE
jgi:hypothetical protein